MSEALAAELSSLHRAYIDAILENFLGRRVTIHYGTIRKIAENGKTMEADVTGMGIVTAQIDRPNPPSDWEGKGARFLLNNRTHVLIFDDRSLGGTSGGGGSFVG
jgi:hypothetical protein